MTTLICYARRLHFTKGHSALADLKKVRKVAGFDPVREGENVRRKMSDWERETNLEL